MTVTQRLRSFLNVGLGTVGSIIGIASGVNSLTGGDLFGSGGGGGGAGAYVPTGRGAADTMWQTILSQLGANVGQQAGTITPGVQAGYAATQPGGMYGNLSQIFGQRYGGALENEAAQQMRNQGVLQDAGVQAWLTSLDPQNALRNQIQQQVTDASRAGTSARGIGMSGQAAGIENQDVSNFLLNWENNQLARQLSGLQGLGGAMQGAGQQASGAGRDLTGAAGLYNTGALFPFQMANAYTGAMSPISQQYGGILQSIIPYLNFGNQASQNAFQQQQVGLNNLTTGLGQLGNIFNQQQQPAAPISDYSTPLGG